MKIAISGSTGFIGKQLSELLLQSGNELVVISRSDLLDGIDHLTKVIKSSDVIINLSGAPVLKRWNEKNMRIILSSRIDTTRKLVAAVQMNLPEHRPNVFISTSAISIYKNGGIHDEQSVNLGSGFLASVCKAWEKETEPLRDLDLRLSIIRIGMVLGKTGGSLKTMLPMFKLGLGGKIGSGKQPFPFIHIEDVCRAIEFLIINNKCTGIYNFVAPDPVNNELFTKVLSKKLHRPAIFTVPSFLLKLIFGKASELLIDGAVIKPSHLLKDGFKFKYPDVESALENIIN
jgi:uncharacterized protein (TIGR01777 family)